ncbi:MAG: peroxiredoxin family protein [Gemmataceae bacterium]|nr:peroxiredoxin family protein [Gemmataceae bacterium]
MLRIVAIDLALVFGLPLTVGAAGLQDAVATPAERYKALVKEYQRAAGGGAKSDQERKQLIERLDKQRPGLAARFLTLAEQNPKHPIAVDALIQAIWMVNNNAFPAGDGPGMRAMAILRRDHLQSDKIGPICQRLNAGFRSEHEAFLRAVLEHSPHQDVRALACLSLGQFLHNRLQRLDEIKERPEVARAHVKVFGQAFVASLQRQDRAAIAREIEALFEQAAGKYRAAKIPYAGTVGARAQAELFEFRHLLVGKQAPDIAGQDQDGRRFKLSDYRGKVVLLDFWNRY